MLFPNVTVWDNFPIKYFYKNLPTVILLLLIFSPQTFSAQSRINEYALSLSYRDTNFKFESSSYATQVETIGINWYESFSPYFQAGLEAGYIQLVQTAAPQASAQYTTGEYAGLLLRFSPIKKPPVTLNLNLNYRYNRTKGENLTQETRFIWHEVLFLPKLHFQTSEKIKLSLGAEYLLTSGIKKNTGSINEIENFEINEKPGMRYGLYFNPSQTEVIGIELSGDKNRVQLYFTRVF